MSEKTEIKAKKIGEIFSDYKTKTNIQYANVKSLNVIKKTGTLEVELVYDEYIEIKEIWYFEKFLRERFQFEHVNIKIRYHESVIPKPIKEEWKNIIAYMAHKHPLTRPMLLLKSDIEIQENNIFVKMHIRGAEFLKARKTDKELEIMLQNLYGISYHVELREELSRKEMQELEENIRNQEKMIISHIEEKQKQMQDENEQDQGVLEYKDPDYQMPQDIDGYIPEEGEIQNYPDMDEEIDEKYIMGKPSKTKEKRVKIKDISSNEGRVTLEGRILTSEVRETRSGKGMLIIDLYDGTGTITCKSFSKDLAEGKEIIEKIQNAKAIKIIGKAGLDTYAGDITVIANTIIETRSRST